MNFIENIIHCLSQSPNRPLLQEVRDGRMTSATCAELLALIRAARAFLRQADLRKGDRCALLAANSIRWAALDLAMMAEGIIAVPLYSRQAPSELVGMMKDCGASLICCGDQALCDGIRQHWPGAPPIVLFDEIFAAGAETSHIKDQPAALADDDPVMIIYTSGTSGEPKGVVLTVGNVTYMLDCTNARLDLLMGQTPAPDQVFHYLPFCFAGSWILLLTCLTRNSALTMSTDLNKLADELKLAAPHYVLNVPVLLERMRQAIEDQLSGQGDFVRTVFEKGQAVWFRRQARTEVASEETPSLLDSLWLFLANSLIFPAIKKKLGPNLKALICGSAPLAQETQLFFMMLGIPVLQVYGLTETTAICTMDHPYRVVPGRVGPAIPGIEMKLGEGDEILVRGPNIFTGYWNRPEETAQVLRNGWFHTGDQGEVDETGNWSIIGRVKNLIVLSSGHNVPPEPIEDRLLRQIPGAQQVVLVGHGRSYLAAIVTGDVSYAQVEAAIERVNQHLPHYKRIRAFHRHQPPFTPENGLLTANGKLKREVIAARFQHEIEELYGARKA
jgi:long-chain acyl-CoA synthetase